MSPRTPSGWDRALANVCLRCPVCRRARERQQGIAYRVVKQIEGGLCPFCRAYERVFGRPAHEGPGRPAASAPRSRQANPAGDDDGSPRPHSTT